MLVDSDDSSVIEAPVKVSSSRSRSSRVSAVFVEPASVLSILIDVSYFLHRLPYHRLPWVVVRVMILGTAIVRLSCSPLVPPFPLWELATVAPAFVPRLSNLRRHLRCVVERLLTLFPRRNDAVPLARW